MNEQFSQQSQNESECSDDYPAKSKENETLLQKIKLKLFIDENFKGSTFEEWQNWNWQIKNSITSTEKLLMVLGKKKNGTIINMPQNHLPFRITPYFVYLLDCLPADHPLYKAIIPTVSELNAIKGEKEDPLDEGKYSPVPNIVHRYPDRALFLVTNFCSTYCRYCTRSHMVSKEDHITATQSQWEKGFQYIENHPEVRDVIISGGDPLTLRDDQIEYILKRLRSIEHVEIIRIGTKVPVVLPMRITKDLMDIFKKYHPLFMSIHFTHPDELTPEVQLACNMLADAGVPLGSQSVLLRGINDEVDIFRRLNKGLLKIRVKPYYIYQCDPIPGSEHFRTDIQVGLDIIKGLRGFTSGYAVPQFVIDAPGGGGKIPLLPNYVKEINENEIILTNYLDKEYSYPL
jgi:lysine 2,3-aminomutase